MQLSLFVYNKKKNTPSKNHLVFDQMSTACQL